MTRRYRADHLLLPSGWVSPGDLEVDSEGMIIAASAGSQGEPDEWLHGYVVAGLPNLHSHAHHRGLVGWADRLRSGAAETLWTWRERMYAQVLALSPDQLEALATQAYVEMLKAGFTSVGEFHYVHHDPAGRPYADRCELSERITAAARCTGIGLTLIPVLYTRGGVNRPPLPEQRRFVCSPDDYLALVEELRKRGHRLAIAPHSLRAVSPAELLSLVDSVSDLPVHIHVAERIEEVEEVRAGMGAEPVRWLLANAPVDERWTLVHATHLDDEERVGAAASGAVAGLCPLTEANLGDGRFELPEWIRAGGHLGVGSDANHLIDAVGELRTLEYGQRLHHRRRDTALGPKDVSAASVLFERALAGGAQALRQPVGTLAPGRRADLVVLDPEHPALVGQEPETVLDAWIFSTAGGAAVRHVMVCGRWVVIDGRHEAEDAALAAFRAAMVKLHSAC